MPLKSLPFALSGFTYLLVGLLVILKHRNKIQWLYGVLCIATCFWQGIWAILFTPMPPDAGYIVLKFAYTGIIFIPTVLYHFIMEFTQKETHPAWLKAAYATSTVLSITVWTGHAFLNGFYRFKWGLAARAGTLHPLFLVLVGFVIIRMLVLLLRAREDAEFDEMRKRRANLVLSAFVVYSLGSLDLLSNYGIPFFPLSPLFAGSSFILLALAVFHYEFLIIATPAEGLEEHQRRLAASQEMARLGVNTAFPLVSQGELLGYLLLGEKMSEEAYSQQDLLLLRIVANQAALAYQRVRYLELAVRGARTEILGEIAGGFAHEIKTPLANISLPAELTFMDLNDVQLGRRKWEEVLPEIKHRMEDIMQQAFQASDKVEAIRQFSKPEQAPLGPVQLTPILQNSIAVLEHLIKKLSVNLKTEFPAVLPPIRGNAKQLEIVFVNLIKNAAEAMASWETPGLARNLCLGGRDDGIYVRLSVKDTGPGIRRTDIGHLFEAYFTTKGSSGTGMGLFLSHQVVKAHGGSIEVKSEEGKGTEFIIRLPKYAEEKGASVHQAA